MLRGLEKAVVAMADGDPRLRSDGRLDSAVMVARGERRHSGSVWAGHFTR
jgi:hypothetical protein